MEIKSQSLMMSTITALGLTLILCRILTKWIKILLVFFVWDQPPLQIFIMEYLMVTKQYSI